MHNLLEFLKKYNYWFLFIVLEIISGTLLFHFNQFQGSVWFTSANDVVARIDRQYADMMAFIRLKQVNKDLTRQNIRLQRQVNELRAALSKANHVPTPTERQVLDSLKGYSLIEARVVSNSILKSENYIVIDKGQDDGVHTEMGVIASGGVVGIVVYAGSHYSMILPTINVKSNISCRIRHSNYFGSLQWDGGSSLYAYLNDVPRYAKIKVGDYVETSGYSTVFPSGIFVGRVVSVDNAPDGLSLQMKVNLSTDFGALSDVCVVVNDERAELESLQLHLMKSGENAQ